MNKKLTALFLLLGTAGVAANAQTRARDTTSVFGQVKTQPPVAESTAVRKEPSLDVVFGDSLGDGMRKAKKLPGDTKVGRTPKEILAAIEGYDTAAIKGKNVLLSCGAANNAFQVASYLPRQLSFLKKEGAARIVVIGVSDKQANLDPAAVNGQIEKIVRNAGCIYGGAIRNAGSDGVHPVGAGYVVLYQQAAQALRTAVSLQAPTLKKP
jgi:hypothetical protein